MIQINYEEFNSELIQQHLVIVFIERAVGADTELIEEHGFTLQSLSLMTY